MAVSITLTQTRDDVTVGGSLEFHVISTISAATDVSTSLFVIKKEANVLDDSFVRVATTDDLQLLGTDRTAALVYYRTNTWTLKYTSVTQAQAAANSIKARLQSLADEYTQIISNFIVSNEQTVFTPTP